MILSLDSWSSSLAEASALMALRWGSRHSSFLQWDTDLVRKVTIWPASFEPEVSLAAREARVRTSVWRALSEGGCRLTSVARPRRSNEEINAFGLRHLNNFVLTVDDLFVWPLVLRERPEVPLEEVSGLRNLHGNLVTSSPTWIAPGS